MSFDGDILCAVCALHYIDCVDCDGIALNHAALMHEEDLTIIGEMPKRKCKSSASNTRWHVSELQFYAVPLIPFFMYFILSTLFTQLRCLGPRRSSIYPFSVPAINFVANVRVDIIIRIFPFNSN